MRHRILNASAVALAILITSQCVYHRETRTELYNENTYLDKDFLTRANPNHEGDPDYGWLMGMSVTAVSVPTPISDIFPGLQADTQYVRFMFTKDTMQVVDAVTLGPYEIGEDPNLVDPRDAADLAPRIMQEWEGSHVDLQLRRNLDGEVTNFVEEYRERDWQDRQHFKLNLEDGAWSDLARLSWYYDWAVSPAMELQSKSLVPGSFRWVDTVSEESNFCEGRDDDCMVDWEKGDYWEFTVRLSYKVDYRYASLMNFRMGTDTQTVDVKYSFWRRPDAPEDSEYVTRPIDEKDKYRRKFGIWDYVLHNYQDPETGFIGAQMYLSRFNPDLPIEFYLVDVPDEFRNHPEYGDVYESVAASANDVFEKAGVDARVAFHDADEGGYVRNFGDIRYSFVVWHNNAFTDIPWLGYGPSWMDPRTGEIINATLNFNNWQGLHWYTYTAREFLENISDAFEEDGGGSCSTPGARRPAIPEEVRSELQNTTLFSKMKSYMGGEDPQDWIPEHSDEFYDYYHMLLNDVRYFYPPYQTFVYSGRNAGTADLADMREDLMERDQKFWEIAGKLDSVHSPTGHDDFTSPGAIEAGIEFLSEAKDSMRAHQELEIDRQMAAGMHGICMFDPVTLIASIASISQKCKEDGTWQTFDEWEDEMRWRIAHQTSVHELGHDLGQWHNFYGSIDHKHYVKCTGCGPDGEDTYGPSSSVMDYVHHFAEAGSDLGYWPYDYATLIYGYRYDSQEEVDAETDPEIIRMLHPDWNHEANGDDPCPEGDECRHPERALLYANDYHRPLSPLVDTFDLGTTPTEIVYNHILYYDFMYQFRNFRSWRQYWETWSYPNSAFSSTFYLRRFLELWTLDWDETGLENDLRLLGQEGDLFFFQNIRDEFNQEMGQANRMIVNFYQAILTQSNAERSYATTYDSFFGDVTRVGIIYDKFYAMMSFLGLWGADMYNWDLYAYLAFYEYNWGNAQCYSDALNTLDAMLGGSYDVYPWFLPTAVLLFAQDTHNINFGDQAKKEWIGFRAFDRAQDMVDYFGFDPRYECHNSDGTIEASCATAALGAEDDGHQTFHDADGGAWVYLFLDDRNQHLCSSADLSPASYKLLWDYNEDVNIDYADYVTTYSIKYYLDYYEYFN